MVTSKQPKLGITQVLFFSRILAKISVFSHFEQTDNMKGYFLMKVKVLYNYNIKIKTISIYSCIHIYIQLYINLCIHNIYILYINIYMINFFSRHLS